MKQLIRPASSLSQAGLCRTTCVSSTAVVPVLFMMFGPSARVVLFLFSLLKPRTQVRYQGALGSFEVGCRDLGVEFWSLDEESQDLFLADYVLTQRDEDEDGFQLQYFVDLLAVLQTCYGGRRR